MNQNQQDASLNSVDIEHPVDDHAAPMVRSERSPNLGAFAQRIIGEQFHRVVKQEEKVLADKDPEPLHHMRVGLRRLRTALTIFDETVELPGIASARQLRNLARALGRLRDLDVQIATLKKDYQPRLSKTEQRLLKHDLALLQKQRRRAFAEAEDGLTQRSYRELKTAYERWLEQPHFKPLAQLPVLPVLPDLLSPLLSALLLHPGWLIAVERLSPDNAPVLHDLRKRCKQVRYQAEFFTPFYGESFQTWLDELRDLQDRLGQVQDGHVLLERLTDKSYQDDMPELQATIHENQKQALSNWETIRQTYLSPDFRYHLHQLLLAPEPSLNEV